MSSDPLVPKDPNLEPLPPKPLEPLDPSVNDFDGLVLFEESFAVQLHCGRR